MTAMGGLFFPRKLLLVEIDRRCGHADCGAKVRIGLTLEDARAFTGFDCERCERWTDGILTERDVPEWWDELVLTAGRVAANADRECETAESASVIDRLSESFRRAQRDRNVGGEGPE